MSEIKYNFRIFDDSTDKVPTVHFDLYDTIKCSIRLDKAEWVNNLKGEKKLNKEDLEIINYIMKNPALSDDFPNETQYSLCRKIWNLNHWDNRVEEMEMPDYLNIK